MHWYPYGKDIHTHFLSKMNLNLHTGHKMSDSKRYTFINASIARKV